MELVLWKGPWGTPDPAKQEDLRSDLPQRLRSTNTNGDEIITYYTLTEVIVL